MAREPGSGEIRFPLRRPADPIEEPAPPAPVRSWRPRPSEPDPLELSGGLPPPPAPPERKPAAEPVFHTVVKGDTLWKISEKTLGSGARYKEIFEANRPMLKDPDKIYPGQVLRIPAK